MLPTLNDFHLITALNTYHLNDLSNLVLNSIDGLGMPPNHRISQRSSRQHGVSDLGFRLDPRIISLHMTLRASTPTEYYADRNSLLEIFRPSDIAYKLNIAIPDGANPALNRQIDCFLLKGPSFDTAKRKGLAQDFEIELIAPDPTFYDPAEAEATADLDSNVSQVDLSISTAGTWLSYPTIEIVGPMEDPCLDSLTTGEELHLIYHVSAGETVTIDCRFGFKTVINNIAANLIDKLSDDSDLATFHIDHEAVADNVIRTYATFQAGQHGHITVKHFDRFIGI